MRRAAQRTEAHSASSNSSGAGPWPLTLAIGLSDSTVRPSAGSSTIAETQPPIRRPWSSTRTIVPTRTRADRSGGIR